MSVWMRNALTIRTPPPHTPPHRTPLQPHPPAGCVCDGRCNLRHPSAADLAALAARPPPRARRAPSAHQQQRSPPASTATAAAADTPTAAKAPPCKFHLQGRCVKGSACPFFHAAPAVSLPAPAPAPARVAPQRSAGLTLHTAAAAARKAANGRGKLTAAPAIPGRRVEGAAMKRGDSAGEDAVAKAKAAAILQKHRCGGWGGGGGGKK